MQSDDGIESLQRRLATYRVTLAHWLEQAALYGGEPFAPPVTRNGIREARQEIRQLKQALHSLGVTVVDLPDDEPPGQPAIPQPSPAPQQIIVAQSSPSPSGAHFSCFISYSHHNEAFAQQLASRLRAAGLNVWFASDDMAAGQKLYDQIKQAIAQQDKLLVILSEHSIESEWVETEIRQARRAEIATGQRKLFPIRLVDMPTLRQWECFDADQGRDLAIEVREYFIPDFSSWHNEEVFERTFARLLRDLHAA